MPRPLRFEFENAWYHVMNRGARREDIFQDEECRKMFLEVVEGSIRLFKIELHAYCLMDNHHHLLVKTPHANLSRAMRHINGVYTQRFNRKNKKDGPLFRGRYKAIIVDGDGYLLQVSRYIYLNPVEAKMVNKAFEYSWSSYLNYLKSSKKLAWLRTDEILGMFGNKQSISRYKNFVESGLDDETKSFYSRDNTPVIFGERKAKEKLLNKLENNQIRSSLSDYKRTKQLPTLKVISRVCANFFNVSEAELFRARRGMTNEPRKIAMYGCRVWALEKLSVIAEWYNCCNHSSISNTVREIENRMRSDKKFKGTLSELMKLCQS